MSVLFCTFDLLKQYTMEALFYIALFVYIFGTIFTKETLYIMYSNKGIWGNRIEYIRETNFKILCPIYNIIFPIYWRIKGIYLK